MLDEILVRAAAEAGAEVRERFSVQEQPLAAALAEYERARNEATAQTYETAVQFAHLQPPPPEVQRLMAVLRDNPEETGRFFGTVTGTVSAAEFFASDNVARIFGELVPDAA